LPDSSREQKEKIRLFSQTKENIKGTTRHDFFSLLADVKRTTTAAVSSATRDDNCPTFYSSSGKRSFYSLAFFQETVWHLFCIEIQNELHN
tara:strand:+ start:1175 stop:1447 length:273 start_codon:yes stop_codon:yes gene_type:complete